MRKNILIIGAGWEQLELIKEAKNQGYYIIATHPFMNPEGLQYADVFFEKDSRDINSHLEIAKTYNIDGVLTDNCDYSLHTASILANALDLSFTSIQSAIYSNNKFAQRVACDNHQIVQPNFFLSETLEDVKNGSSKLNYPIIVKPVDSRGTFGVTIVDNSNSLKEAFIEALIQSPSRRVICEEFIEGTLVTVDGFCFKNGHRSLTVASRIFEQGIKPVTKEIIYPANFDAALKTNLLKNHHDVVSALGYDYGHTHGEYIIDNEKRIYLVECANRGGGVYTSSSIVPELTRINVNKILIDQSLNQDNFEIEKNENGHMTNSVMLTFLDFEVGRVIKSINLKEVLSLPYVLKFRTLFKEKDMVESIENCAGRHSMLVINGKNVREVYQNLEEFNSKLKIEYYNL